MEKRKEKEPGPFVSFKEQTPEVYVDHSKPDPTYERAFGPEGQSTSDYDENTTTWD